MRVYAVCEVAGEAHFTHREHGIQVGLIKPDHLKIYQYVEHCLATRTDFNVCWPWPSDWANAGGYGVMSHRGEVGIYAHRLAYKLATGEDPGDMCVLHTCDNPACFNPSHLKLGSHEDNMRDMIAKGRAKYGQSRVGVKKCSPEEVREIRRMRQEGISRIEVSQITGRSMKTITDVTLRKRHKKIN